MAFYDYAVRAPALYQSALRPDDSRFTTNMLERLALDEPGNGGLQLAQSYEVTKPNVKVYRLWNSEHAGGEMGNWWTFRDPRRVAVSQFRREYNVCAGWGNPLDMLTSATLKVGTHVVLGPGQSAKCNPFLTYPASPRQQVYIPYYDDVPIADRVENVERLGTLQNVFA